MSNIIDSIKLSGTVYTLSAQTEGGGVPESAFTAYTASTNERISQDEEVTAAALNVLNVSLSGKQDTLSAGTNITISGNVISAEGGGKAIEAGRGIIIYTGATADTVSFNLPISAGTGTGSIVFSNGKTNGKCSLAIGDNSKNPSLASEANGQTSFSCGLKTIANKDYSAAFGDRITTKNKDEFGCGSFNNSVSASTSFGDSGNTLFSVGNGTANNARHNAFEIRQNGDIYLSSGGTDIKLQDHLGGSSITVDTELDSGSTNPVQNKVIYNKFDEVEEVTAAGLNAVNDKFGGLKLVKLTQSEYDSLTTKDPSTLYVIVD